MYVPQVATRNAVLALAGFAGLSKAHATVILTVGPGDEFSTIPAAIAASQSGDTIDVQAGTYTNEFAKITDSIILEAVGGRVNMVATERPLNDKGIFIIGDTTNAPDVTITGFDFEGAQIPARLGGNGAGIRYQSGNLTLNDDWFHNNQDGLLATPFVAGTGKITINQSEFGFNGTGTGETHNIYVGVINSLTITNSYIHDADAGMEIQSRAENNTIEDNRIFDNNSTASYSISLPNGGDDTVSGNIIEKGLHSQNHTTMIAFMQAPGSGVPTASSDQGHWANSSLIVSDNTFINDIASSVPAVWDDSATLVSVTVSDNSFWNVNPAKEVLGSATVSGSMTLARRQTLTDATYAGTSIDTPGTSTDTPGTSTDTPGTSIDTPGTDVPEPASLALLGIGLVGLGVVRRKRN